jgi:hypothetical protein
MILSAKANETTVKDETNEYQMPPSSTKLKISKKFMNKIKAEGQQRKAPKKP